MKSALSFSCLAPSGVSRRCCAWCLTSPVSSLLPTAATGWRESVPTARVSIFQVPLRHGCHNCWLLLSRFVYQTPLKQYLDTDSAPEVRTVHTSVCVSGVLVGNKSDLSARREVQASVAQEWAQGQGLEYHEASAVSVSCPHSVWWGACE